MIALYFPIHSLQLKAEDALGLLPRLRHHSLGHFPPGECNIQSVDLQSLDIR